MAIWSKRRPSEALAIPDGDAAAHELTLGQRADAAAARVVELQSQVTETEGEHHDSAVEGRLDDHAAAGERLVALRTELAAAVESADVLRAAQREVAMQRQRDQWSARAAECEARRDELSGQIQQRLTALPVMLAELQQECRALLSLESELSAAHGEAEGLRIQLATPEGEQPVFPRYPNRPHPVSGFFSREPKFRSLANDVWAIGVQYPQQRPQQG